MTAQPPIMGDAKAVQQWFGLSRTMLFRLERQNPDFPVSRIGGRVLYDFADLRAWIKDRRGTNGSYGD